jgi:hypothetical protein
MYFGRYSRNPPFIGKSDEPRPKGRLELHREAMARKRRIEGL